MSSMRTNVLIVGGGPGGYVAAIRCGQLGLETVLVESDRLGGTCLIRGCIPSKALIHAADEFRTVSTAFTGNMLGIRTSSAPEIDLAATMAWKEAIVGRLSAGVSALLKRAKVRVVNGWAKFSDGKTCSVETAEGAVTIVAENVVLATGSVPFELPFLPFGGDVISSTEALALDRPPDHLVVIGGGYIGLELGIAYRKLGSRVTVVEQQDSLLPLYDAALTSPVKKWLVENGVEVHLGVSAKGLSEDQTALRVMDRDGGEFSIAADKYLVAVGRKPATEGWGIENMSLERDGPFIAVDERCATSMKNVWAIGDLVGEPMLAHKASAQGKIIAEIIAGHKRRFDPIAIPAVCFTSPEVVSVGLSPKDAVKDDAIVASFPFSANGRALTMEAGDQDGFVRVVANRASGVVLGVQAVGSSVSELSAAFATAIEMQCTLEDIAAIIQAHPGLGEGFHEAALKALGHAIHI